LADKSFFLGISETAWTVIIGIGTLILALYTLFKDFLQDARLAVHIGDSISLVKSSDDGQVRKIHIGCTFTNDSRNGGVITVVRVIIRNDDRDQVFKARQFIVYDGIAQSNSQGFIRPVYVPGNSCTVQAIEFETETMSWKEGKHRIFVQLWKEGVNNLELAPDATSEFEINIDNKTAEWISSGAEQAVFRGALYIPVPIVRV
jgi:hypothetical protein